MQLMACMNDTCEVGGFRCRSDKEALSHHVNILRKLNDGGRRLNELSDDDFRMYEVVPMAQGTNLNWHWPR